MRFYNRIEAVCRMNRLGAERRPFLFVIDYKQEQVIVEEPDQIDSEALLYNLDGVTNVVTASRMNDRENRTSAIRWETFPITQSAYADSFHKVVGHIRAGNSYLVNLTCATPVRTDLSLKDVFVSSEARYKLWMKDRFVVFSPEIFVKIRDEHIYSYPMKGTIDATLPDARRRILEDPKETAEHATIVDLIRNDLSMVATEVMVTRYRYIDELPTHQGGFVAGQFGDPGSSYRRLAGRSGRFVLPAPSGRFHYRGAQKEDNGDYRGSRDLRKGVLYGCHGLF